MNKQRRYTTLTTTMLTATLVATLALAPLANHQVFAGGPPTFVRICHYDDNTELWGPLQINENGLNGHLSNHTDGSGIFDHVIAFDGSEDESCLALNQGDPFDGFKTWTHTDYNWDPVCIETVPILNEDNEIIGEECIVYRPANINIPEDYVLADSLDLPIEDGISDVQVQVKKNGEISNMNPGAIYALTAVNVLTDLDMLQVDEHYADCTDEELELLNQNNLSRNVKVAVADPDGWVTEVTDRLYDELDTGVVLVGIDDDLATVKINDSSLLTDEYTVFVLVKFDDQLRGDSYTESFTCLNDETVTSTIGGNEPFELIFEATLRFTEAS